jgi:hypothetical protein
MANADLTGCDEPLIISSREVVETNENGKVQLKHDIVEPVFVYDKETGNKIVDFTVLDDALLLKEPYRTVIVDYSYQYDGGYRDITVGRAFTYGYLSLEGKTRVKDDITGQIKTGIIRIPKLKLMSDLSIRLGRDAMPTVGRLNAVAVPSGQRGNKKVMEIIFLNDDIDSDM